MSGIAYSFISRIASFADPLGDKIGRCQALRCVTSFWTDFLSGASVACDRALFAACDRAFDGIAKARVHLTSSASPASDSPT